MHEIKRQRGFTMLGWLVVLTVAGFFIMIGLKVGPVYLENYTIRSVIQSLQNEPLINRKPIGEIRTMLMRRLDINNIRSLQRDQIQIKRTGGVTTISLIHEERRPVIGNVDVIIAFDEFVELIAN